MESGVLLRLQVFALNTNLAPSFMVLQLKWEEHTCLPSVAGALEASAIFVSLGLPVQQLGL